jgi:hypothetical protein
MFSSLSADEIRRRKHSADLSFLNQGITFTVYGREEGTEPNFSLRPSAAPYHQRGMETTSNVDSRSGSLHSIYFCGHSTTKAEFSPREWFPRGGVQL